MDQQTVKFYFADNSPFASLANTHIKHDLAPFAVTLEYKPVYSARRGGEPDPDAPRMKYLQEDFRRFADAYGLRLHPGPFADSKKACLGFFFAQERGRRKAYHDGVYTARWLDGKDIGQDEVLAEIAERCGLSRTEFLSALSDPHYEAALARSNAEAETAGVFGFPLFLYAEQKFWGNDRVE